MTVSFTFLCNFLYFFLSSPPFVSCNSRVSFAFNYRQLVALNVKENRNANFVQVLC